jgi:hypothetical protein
VSLDVTGGIISVDVEVNGGDGGSWSVQSLSDEEGLSGEGSAVDFKVDLVDEVLSSGPSAGENDSLGLDIESLDASKVLDISGGIFLGIGGIGGHLNGGRVKRPNSDGGINSCNPNVVNGSWGKIGDSGERVIGGDEADDS